jgi:long-chain acyl-CoA synthetase
MAMTDSFASMPGLMLSRMSSAGGATILRRKERGIWKPMDWAALGARARAIGMGLKQAGLQPGEVVALLSDISPDAIAVDLAILGAGCVAVALYPTDDAGRVAAQLQHSTARMLFVESEEQLDKALSLRESCPDLRGIVVMDMKGLRDFADPGCIGLDDLVARGVAHDAAHARDWEAGIAAIGPDDLAVIAMTAGSAAAPRGVMLTHGNIMHQVGNFSAACGLGVGDERLAFLPLCGVAERVLGLYAALFAGVVTNLVENAETVPENLQEVRPTVMLAMPRIWEKFHARIVVAVAEAGWVQAQCYGLALRVALGGGRGVARMLAGLVLGRVRVALGLDRLRWAGVASAAIAPELVRWYRALGIEIVETYGTTECGGLACMMPRGATRPGVAGRPVPWGEVMLAEDGEILLRGPHVAPGYWRDDALTASVLRDGWLHTGDLGAMEDGYLRIAGRRTDELVTRDGLAVAPSALEAALKVSPYIADVLVVGDGRAALACLVMLESEAVEKWAQDHNVVHTSFASLVATAEVTALVGREVARVNAGGAAIGDFRIIGRRLGPDDHELAPTMKLRRFVVMQEYAGLIEEMYGRDAAVAEVT